jgi:glycerol uptake facilitator-like aquaporin
MFGMWMVMVIALGGVANHVLNPTTGRGMGYGFIAINFGFAFAFPIIGFGAVSAMFNPAASLALVTAGLLGGGQFFTVVTGGQGTPVASCIWHWHHPFPPPHGPHYSTSTRLTYP